MSQREINILEMAIAVLLLAGLNMAYPIFRPGGFDYPATIDFGLCLPSANLWQLGGWSHIASVAMLVVTGVLLVPLNRKYNITRSLDLATPVVFLSLCAAFPWIASKFNSSLIAVAVNLASLWIFFDATKQKDSTVSTFIVGTMLALGSMIQYGFVLLMPLWLIIGFNLRIMTPRSIVAYLLGIISPYWCAIGTGLLPLSAFRLPDFSRFFNVAFTPETTLGIMLFLGVVTLLELLLGLSNIFRLYSANRSVRIFHQAICTLGLAMPVLMVADFHNLFFYSTTLLMCLGFECGYVMASTRDHKINGWLILLMLASAGYGISHLIPKGNMP